jgi:hypothetical protein
VSRPVLLSVSGRMGAGKDTVGRAVMRRCCGDDWVRLSVGDLVREEVDRLVLPALRGAAWIDEAVARLARSAGVDPLAAGVTVGLLWGPVAVREVSAAERSPEMRAVLQWWGTDVRRAADAGWWLRRFLARLEGCLADGVGGVLVTDARFPDEIAALAGAGFLTVWLEVPDEVRRRRLRDRDGWAPEGGGGGARHRSETALGAGSGCELVLDNAGDDPGSVVETLTAALEARRRAS